MSLCCAGVIVGMMLIVISSVSVVLLHDFVTISASEDSLVIATFSCTLQECTLVPDVHFLFPDDTASIETSKFLSLASCTQNMTLAYQKFQFMWFGSGNAYDVLIIFLYLTIASAFMAALFAAILFCRPTCCGTSTLPVLYLFSSVCSMAAAGHGVVASLAMWFIVTCLGEFSNLPLLTVTPQPPVYVLPCIVFWSFLCSLVTLFAWCCCPVTPRNPTVVVVGLELGDVINAAVY